jgi:YidC/Oxa1 family membrane protein insertase
MDEQNRNMLLAIVLSFLVIFVWTVFFSPPPPDPATESPAEIAAQGGDLTPSSASSETSTAATGDATEATEATEIERIQINSPRVTGSISLKGGRIDDLKLEDYKETIEPDSPIVTLLKPASEPHAYYAVHGWVGKNGLSQDLVPSVNTVWKVEAGDVLTPSTPVTLVWDNGAGQVFHKEISLDDNYLFTIKQSVSNESEQRIELYPYGYVTRYGQPPDLKNFFVLHEGAIGSYDGSLEEVKYKDIVDFAVDPTERAALEMNHVGTNGWVGFTDHYWMSTLIAEPGDAFDAVIKYTPDNDRYSTEMRYGEMSVAGGASAEVVSHYFAGAKEFFTIRDYQDKLGINQFVDSIDWGWFAFLTKPIFRVLHFMKEHLGNMGLAIISLTFIMKLLLFPLAYKSYVSMSKMKKLQPEMEKIKETAGDDRVKLQQEMMALYKKEKVNPASGCLPILVQIPIFFSLYKVIFVTIDLRQAPFYGWIHDLSMPDPTSVLNLFGLLPFDAPDPTSFLAIFSIGVWPILMGITMWMQQKLNPAPADKTQATIFAWMPWVFMFMLGRFASGLVIYWTFNNIITFIQQYTIMRSQGVKPDVFGNIFKSLKRDKATE